MQDIGLGSRRAKKKIDTSGMAGVADVADLDSAWRLRRRRERQHGRPGVRSSEYIPTLLSFRSVFDTSGPIEGKWRLIKRREKEIEHHLARFRPFAP